MFATDEEVASHINSDVNLVRRRANNEPAERKVIRDILPVYDEDTVVIKPTVNSGRRPGDKNLPDFMRSVIGATAHLDTLAHTAKAFEVSTHHVHELKHGKHSNAQGVNEELVDEINEKLETPHDLAIQKLTQALIGINPDLVTKQTDKSRMAVQLAAIADKTAPIKREEDRNENCKLIVYAPTFKQENKYETVQVPHTSL